MSNDDAMKTINPRCPDRLRPRWLRVIAGVALLPVAALWADEPFVLVQEGRPVATIVLAAKPTENAQAAAAELQRYLRKISGAELAGRQRRISPPAGPLVLVGSSRLTDQMPGLDIPAGLTPQLREEGFVLHCRSDRLVLAGNDAGPYYGTRYAVAELLHRLGVRWFMPGEFGEVVPQARHACAAAGDGGAPAPGLPDAQLLAAPPRHTWTPRTPTGRSTTR